MGALQFDGYGGADVLHVAARTGAASRPGVEDEPLRLEAAARGPGGPRPRQGGRAARRGPFFPCRSRPPSPSRTARPPRRSASPATCPARSSSRFHHRSVSQAGRAGDPLPERGSLGLGCAGVPEHARGAGPTVVPQLTGCRCRLGRDQPGRRVGADRVGAEHRAQCGGEPGERGIEAGGARPARVCRVHGDTERRGPSDGPAPGAARPGRACCGRRRPPRCTPRARSPGRRRAGPGCTCRPRSRRAPGRRPRAATEAAARSSAPGRARAGPSSSRGPGPTRACLRQGAGVVHERSQRQPGCQEGSAEGRTDSRSETSQTQTRAAPPDPRRPRPRRRPGRHGRRRARRGARWRRARPGPVPCAGPARTTPRSPRRGARPGRRPAGLAARSGGDGARRTRPG